MSDTEATPQTPQPTQARQFHATLWALLALTAAVRLVGISRPLLGEFATRNVVYAMVARNWAAGRADIRYPTLDVLRDGQRSVILVDFPVSAYLTAGAWRVFGGSLDVWGRATSVVFSMGSVGVMFLWVGRRHGQTAAAAAAVTVALSPISVIYGQSFMLEASLVFFTLATFYALDRWADRGHIGWALTAAVCLNVLLLTKIYMLVILLPLWWMGFHQQGLPDRPRFRRAVVGKAAGNPAGVRSGRSAQWCFGLVLVLGMLLPCCWCADVFRQTSPGGALADRTYYSLRHGAQGHLRSHELLLSADFYRQVLDDLAGVVLTPVGFVVALAGLLDRRWRRYAAWLLAMVVLVAVVPLKFYKINYYYMAVLPPLGVMVGLGWEVICRRVRPGRATVGLLMIVVLVFSLRHSVKPAFVTPEEDRAVPAAAAAVRELTTEDEPVVTMHGTTIDLLYYCDRPGWALDPETESIEASLDHYHRRGARWLVVVGRSPDLPGLTPHSDGYYTLRLGVP